MGRTYALLGWLGVGGKQLLIRGRTAPRGTSRTAGNVSERSHNGCAMLGSLTPETDTNHHGHRRIDVDTDEPRKPGHRRHQTIWPDMACKRSRSRQACARRASRRRGCGTSAGNAGESARPSPRYLLQVRRSAIMAGRERLPRELAGQMRESGGSSAGHDRGTTGRANDYPSTKGRSPVPPPLTDHTKGHSLGLRPAIDGTESVQQRSTATSPAASDSLRLP